MRNERRHQKPKKRQALKHPSFTAFLRLCSLATRCTTRTGVCQAIVAYSYLDLQWKCKFTRCGIKKKKEKERKKKKKKAATSINCFVSCFKILHSVSAVNVYECIVQLINVRLSSALSECYTAAQWRTSQDISSLHACCLRHNILCLSQ